VHGPEIDADGAERFTEAEAAAGSLGHRHGIDLMP
jgi:2,3-bisphosphoglycerate-independent phosphoglycerate mutase